MADRKVLIKYFPKNFNPKLLVKRGRGKDKLMNVRNMLPMSLRCNVCANYLYIGTKFNMRMEICNEETYLGIKVFRFYLKCTYCYNEICFKTDPKNHDYIVEDGGTRNYQPIKDAEQAQKLMKKMRKQQKQGNSMKFLETKTYDSKREMELMQALDDIKNLNKRHALIDPEDLLNNMFVEEEEREKFTEDEQKYIEQTFNELRKKKLAQLKIFSHEGNVIQQQDEMSENQNAIQQKVNYFSVKDPQDKAAKYQQQRAHALTKGGLISQHSENKSFKPPTKSKLPNIKSIKKEVVPFCEAEKPKNEENNGE